MMADSNRAQETYTLYYNDYSLCSLFVRFTLALCRDMQGQPISVEEQRVDIQHGGQLSEQYLCLVNPKGTVPVLTHPTQLSVPITESLDITLHFGHNYPGLFEPHSTEDKRNLRSVIRSLLGQLHALNFFSLTYTHKPQRAADMRSGVENLLSDTSISERYRQALEYKLQVVLNTRAPALDPPFVEGIEEKAAAFLAKVETSLESSKDSQSPWILGTDKATALDAHTVPFLARLLDVGRGNMLGDRTRAYAEKIFGMEAWKQVMQGRRTVYNRYL